MGKREGAEAMGCGKRPREGGADLAGGVDHIDLKITRRRATAGAAVLAATGHAVQRWIVRHLQQPCTPKHLMQKRQTYPLFS